MTAAFTSPGAQLARLREARPLVHNITNFVAMDLAANVLLAAGASPAMAHGPEEVEEFVSRADALTVNTGTMDGAWAHSARLAAHAARRLGTPWVLDPVGAGATAFRRETPASLLEIGPTVLRGNASEILAVSGRQGGRGVDSTESVAASEAAAFDLAAEYGLVVAVTGAHDFVTDGSRRVRVSGGDPMMTRVTAVGCALTALVGAFLAVEKDPMAATLGALTMMAVAGGQAAPRAEGPGSFRVMLLDRLFALSSEELDLEARIEWL